MGRVNHLRNSRVTFGREPRVETSKASKRKRKRTKKQRSVLWFLPSGAERQILWQKDGSPPFNGLRRSCAVRKPRIEMSEDPNRNRAKEGGDRSYGSLQAARREICEQCIAVILKKRTERYVCIFLSYFAFSHFAFSHCFIFFLMTLSCS